MADTGLFLLFEDFPGRREYRGVTLVIEEDWCGYVLIS